MHLPRLSPTLCRLFGHRRRYTTVRRMRHCRGGYMALRDCTRVHCARCGCGGDGCYEESAIERLTTWWRGVLDRIEACKHAPARDGFRDDEIPF